MRRLLLVGNGLSITANPGFRLDTLTAAVAARLDAVALGDQPLRQRLQAIATQLEADNHQSALGTSFERLLGPLDRLRNALDAELASTLIAVRPALVGPLQDISGEVARLHTRGCGDPSPERSPVTRAST